MASFELSDVIIHREGYLLDCGGGDVDVGGILKAWMMRFVDVHGVDSAGRSWKNLM